MPWQVPARPPIHAGNQALSTLTPGRKPQSGTGLGPDGAGLVLVAFTYCPCYPEHRRARRQSRLPPTVALLEQVRVDHQCNRRRGVAKSLADVHHVEIAGDEAARVTMAQRVKRDRQFRLRGDPAELLGRGSRTRNWPSQVPNTRNASSAGRPCPSWSLSSNCRPSVRPELGSNLHRNADDAVRVFVSFILSAAFVSSSERQNRTVPCSMWTSLHLSAKSSPRLAPDAKAITTGA